MILQQTCIKCDIKLQIVYTLQIFFTFLMCFFHVTMCHVEKYLHMTDFSPQPPPVVPVTNIRYACGSDFWRLRADKQKNIFKHFRAP